MPNRTHSRNTYEARVYGVWVRITARKYAALQRQGAEVVK